MINIVREKHNTWTFRVLVVVLELIQLKGCAKQILCLRKGTLKQPALFGTLECLPNITCRGPSKVAASHLPLRSHVFQETSRDRDMTYGKSEMQNMKPKIQSFQMISIQRKRMGNPRKSMKASKL